MTGFEIYTLVLCIIVYVLLTTLSIVVVTIITKQTLKLIRLGDQDKIIIGEDKKKNKSKVSKAFDYIVTGLFTLIFLFFFCSSMYINCVQNTYFESAPTYKVVKTGSMAEKNEKNLYLYDNNLNNQIQTFDLIATYKLPDEMDLKLYDIVVYELDGILLVHRIVGIEEPNGEHPNNRYFLLQGDAVENPDRFPVLYSQMKGIYRGERIPAVGSFVLFMQSPAGWMCIILVAVAIVATPILEKKLAKAMEQRRLILLANTDDNIELAVSTEQPVDSTAIQVEDETLSIRRKDFRTFAQKLEDSPKHIQDRYNQIEGLLSRISGVRVIVGRKQQSFKKGNLSVARFLFRGKTLCLLLGLNPQDYTQSKYIFTDYSGVKAHANYPMRIKLTSDRQVRWSKELINQLIKNNNFELGEEKPFEEIAIYENVVEQVVNNANEQTVGFGLFNFNNRTSNLVRMSFGQRLRRSKKEVKERYKKIREYLIAIDGVWEIESDSFRTFRLKNNPLAKITMKGKTLNVYLALNPQDYANTKYIFEDVSSVKKYASYPMRIRLSSDRQAKWTCELIDKIVQGYLVKVGV